MSAALEARGLTFAWNGQPVVRGVSLAAGHGEVLGILGPNGAGKSTLLRLLAGGLRPGSGEVHLMSAPIQSLPHAERAKRVAFVPQESRPVFDLPVMSLVLLGRAPHLGLLGVEGPRDREIAREALAFTDTDALAERPFSRLSSGEKQRVMLARALAQQTPVVLLDEPTAFLDLGHQHQTYELLSRLRRERGVTLVIASHDLNLAARHCDRLILMTGGAVVAEGEPASVLTPDRIARTYGVAARVAHDADAGLVVTPLGSLPRPAPFESQDPKQQGETR